MATAKSTGKVPSARILQDVKPTSPYQPKMNWFDRWLQAKIQNVVNNMRTVEDAPMHTTEISEDSVKFDIISCDGGLLVVLQRWNNALGRTYNRYIIRNDEDVGKRLSEIISFDALRK